MEAETSHKFNACPQPRSGPRPSRLPALITLFIFLGCCLRTIVLPIATCRSAADSHWETLRSHAPATLTVQLVSTPFPHLEGRDHHGELLWQGFQSSEIVKDITGWGGPISLGIIVDDAFRILHLTILQHSETLSFFRGIEEPWFLGQFIGKDPSSKLEPGIDIDGLSQATVSVTALCQTVRATLKKAAQDRVVPTGGTPTGSFGQWAVYHPVFLLLTVFSVFTIRRRFPRVHTLLVVILIGIVSPQFVSFAHIAVIQRFVQGAATPTRHVTIILLACLFLCVYAPRGYCRFLCPAGALQMLLYRPCLSSRSSSKINSTAEFNTTQAARALAFTPWSLGRIILWGGLLLLFFIPDFPLHQLEVFSALLFRNQGIAGWMFVLAFFVGALMNHRWYCLTLCPLHHFFADLDSVMRFRSPSQSARDQHHKLMYAEDEQI